MKDTLCTHLNGSHFRFGPSSLGQARTGVFVFFGASSLSGRTFGGRVGLHRLRARARALGRGSPIRLAMIVSVDFALVIGSRRGRSRSRRQNWVTARDRLKIESPAR